MKFVINKEQLEITPKRFLRQAGYAYIRDRRTGANSFAKRLGQNFYPRFHIYINHMSGNAVFNLHLDQKKPSYAGASAHSAEYGGEAVEREVERLKKLILSNTQNPEQKDKPNKKQSWWKRLING
ncbi:MAG: hypothetical protein KAJ48_02230 [Elusimicrobiales bacterium]|nr:hypothetical protein [Elusimicrobiales bacterium]